MDTLKKPELISDDILKSFQQNINVTQKQNQNLSLGGYMYSLYEDILQPNMFVICTLLLLVSIILLNRLLKDRVGPKVNKMYEDLIDKLQDKNGLPDDTISLNKTHLSIENLPHWM